MTTEEIRSIVRGPIGAIASATIGGLLFRWQVKRWSRWIPQKVGKKGRDRLLIEHKTNNRIAKALSIVGICCPLPFYWANFLDDHDWRGLGIGAGLMSALPICYILAVNLRLGLERIKEGMVAFAIDQKTPSAVLFGLMTVCIVGGIFSTVSLLLRP